MYEEQRRSKSSNEVLSPSNYLWHPDSTFVPNIVENPSCGHRIGPNYQVDVLNWMETSSSSSSLLYESRNRVDHNTSNIVHKIFPSHHNHRVDVDSNDEIKVNSYLDTCFKLQYTNLQEGDLVMWQYPHKYTKVPSSICLCTIIQSFELPLCSESTCILYDGSQKQVAKYTDIRLSSLNHSTRNEEELLQILCEENGDVTKALQKVSKTNNIGNILSLSSNQFEKFLESVFISIKKVYLGYTERLPYSDPWLVEPNMGTILHHIYQSNSIKNKNAIKSYVSSLFFGCGLSVLDMQSLPGLSKRVIILDLISPRGKLQRTENVLKVSSLLDQRRKGNISEDNKIALNQYLITNTIQSLHQKNLLTSTTSIHRDKHSQDEIISIDTSNGTVSDKESDFMEQSVSEDLDESLSQGSVMSTTDHIDQVLNLHTISSVLASTSSASVSASINSPMITKPSTNLHQLLQSSVNNNIQGEKNAHHYHQHQQSQSNHFSKQHNSIKTASSKNILSSSSKPLSTSNRIEVHGALGFFGISLVISQKMSKKSNQFITDVRVKAIKPATAVTTTTTTTTTKNESLNFSKLINPGDRVVKINGKCITSMTRSEIIDYLRPLACSEHSSSLLSSSVTVPSRNVTILFETSTLDIKPFDSKQTLPKGKDTDEDEDENKDMDGVDLSRKKRKLSPVNRNDDNDDDNKIHNSNTLISKQLKFNGKQETELPNYDNTWILLSWRQRFCVGDHVFAKQGEHVIVDSPAIITKFRVWRDGIPQEFDTNHFIVESDEHVFVEVKWDVTMAKSWVFFHPTYLALQSDRPRSSRRSSVVNYRE